MFLHTDPNTMTRTRVLAKHKHYHSPQLDN